MRNFAIAFAFLASLPGCGKDEPGWETQERPRALAALAAHQKLLTTALGALPASFTETACVGPEPELPRRTIRPQETSPGLLVVSRDRATEITSSELKLFPHGPELYTHLESGPYYRLFRPMSGGDFSASYASLEGSRFVAVVTTESLEPGVVEKQAIIVKPASFKGWAAIVDVRQPRIVAQLRIEAASAKTVAIRHSGDLDLTGSLMSQIFAQLDAALARACPAS